MTNVEINDLHKCHFIDFIGILFKKMMFPATPSSDPEPGVPDPRFPVRIDCPGSEALTLGTQYPGRESDL
jgi:hypothetical protein